MDSKVRMTADHLSNIDFDIEPTGIIIILRCASEANAFVSIYLPNLQPGGSRETLDSTLDTSSTGNG